MAASRRSKRIQALNQSNEDSGRVDESPESSKKYHREKRKMAESQGGMSEGHSKEQASKEQPPKEQPPKGQAPGIDSNWAEQEKREADENRRKRAWSKECLHRKSALDRLDYDVEKCWKSLAGSISALVNVPSICDVTWDSLDEALQQKFISYAPNAEELFEVYSMNWHHDFPYYDEIESHKFPHCRYTTMDLYMSLKVSPRNLRRINSTCVVPIIAKALGRYFPEEYDERDLANETYPALRNLANNAADMEFLFDANLTVFSHVFHHPITQQTCGFPFLHELEGIEGQAMKDHYSGLSRNEEGQNVDFVVNPMLLQRGHHYGYGYRVKRAVHPMEACVARLEAHRNQPDSPEVDGKEEHGGKRDDATAEEKSREVAGLTKEEKSREEVDKEKDDKDEDDEAVTEEGGKNNKNKERADEEVDEGEEEGDLTQQKEKKTNTKNTTKSKKKKKDKGKRHQQ
ncbi:hypothetical protein FACUT_7231 [Fusarium acutatum]|uniref:Uncharacterized protein n=1 Tax=Fusarium acutatum TaxID=78861 RepID=A0A8H4JN63_9HYPO|nr:hypothetical protein FACUT_7231 [Fusarium acutatum]